MVRDLIGIEWVVASIAPWTLAPHPNFSDDIPRPESLLALIADLRLNEVDRYTPKVETFPSWAERLISAANASLISETQESASITLQELVSDDDLPLGARAAAALFSAVVLAELDQRADAIRILTEADSQTQPLSSDSARLIRCVLRQQRALRQLEHGRVETAVEDATFVVESIDRISSEGFDSFSASPSLAWSYQQIQQDIADVTSRRARRLLSMLAPLSDNSWVDLVRARPAWLDVRADRRVTPGLEASLNSQFEDLLRATSRSIGWAIEDPILGPIDAGLLNAELAGDVGDARSLRGLSGRARMLRVYRNVDELPVAIVADGIRLLRQARDRKALDSSLQLLRSNGPIAALQQAARRVLTSYARSRETTRFDLAVLLYAADVLTADERQTAITAAQGYLRQEREPGASQGLDRGGAEQSLHGRLCRHSRRLPWSRTTLRARH